MNVMRNETFTLSDETQDSDFLVLTRSDAGIFFKISVERCFGIKTTV